MLLMMLVFLRVVVLFFFDTRTLILHLLFPWRSLIFPPSGSPPKNLASLRTGHSTSFNDVPSSFFEDFKAFGFFFSLLDPENIYLLALVISICGFLMLGVRKSR